MNEEKNKVVNLFKLRIYAITKNNCSFLFMLICLFLFKYVLFLFTKNFSNHSYELFKNIQNNRIEKGIRVGIISNENYEYINKFENFLKENNIQIEHSNNSSEIKYSKIFDFIFQFIINKKKITNKEDEIEIIYSFNFFDEIILSFLKAKKSI